MNKTKKIIFEAAIRTFSQKGFHKSTMDEIAENAGIAKGTLYYHFKKKEDVFKFIVDEVVNIIDDEIKTKTAYLDNPLDKLRMICRIQLGLVLKHIDFFKISYNHVWVDEDRKGILKEILEKYLGLMKGYLKEAAEKGLVEEKNIEIIAFNFFGSLISAVIYSATNRDWDREELTDTLVEMMLKGIKKK